MAVDFDSLQLYSREEVSKHDSASDAWVVVDGRVYDITPFLDSHPGGLGVTEEYLGSDISAVVRSSEVHVHSSTAFELLQQYCIGRVEQEVAVDHKYSSSVQRSWKEDDLVDWSKPLLWQVAKIGPHYNEWVHAPVNRKLRLFESDYVEALSRCPWWVVPIVWIPVIFYLCHLAMSSQPSTLMPWLPPSQALSLLQLVGLLPLGYLLWTFIEYSLHRFVFHLNPPPSSPLLTTFHFAIHGQHHKVPFDTMRLVFPPAPAAIITLCLYIPLGQLIPLSVGRALFAGALIGYISYDLTHYYIHHGSPRPGSYFASLKAYHVAHHYINYNLVDIKEVPWCTEQEPMGVYYVAHHYINYNLGFGISSKLWDIPFGTALRLSKEQTQELEKNE